MPKFSPHEKIGDIQVLRGIAIVMVLFYHLSISATAAAVWPVKITVPLYLGVEIFFVVSGFVITRSLMNDDFRAARFFIKRIFRLMPALLLFVGLTLVLNRYVQNADLTADGKAMMSVSNRAFRQQARGIVFGYFNVVPTPASYANGAMWSLSVEDQFYVGVTLLCLAAGVVFRARPRWTGAVMAASATAFYLCLAAWRLATRGHIADGPSVLFYLTAWRFDFLGLGVMTAFIDRRLGERIRAVFRDSGTYCSAFLLLVPLMLAAVCESPLAGAAPVLNGVCFVAIGLCFAALVLLAANGLAFPSSRGPVYQMLKLLGDRSYTYYLFHFPMFIVAWLLFQAGFPAAFSGPWHYEFAQCVAVAVLLIPFAEVVYRCLELPLADLGRRLAGKMKEAAARRNQFCEGNEAASEHHVRRRAA
ncbi:MAG TPA: acyltransferase [Pirellulales bacterium]|nr:acyltransferase [Pirellulales bacterium]